MNLKHVSPDYSHFSKKFYSTKQKESISTPKAVKQSKTAIPNASGRCYLCKGKMVKKTSKPVLIDKPCKTVSCCFHGNAARRKRKKSRMRTS